MTLKIRPSSAAWMMGKSVITDTPSGCLRYLVLKKEHPKPDQIKPELQEMGEMGEKIYMKKLEETQPWPFHRELPFEVPIEDGVIKGRIDFITYHDSFKVIHECKTSQSKDFNREVIGRGIPKSNHIAQVVMYLLSLYETRAKLVALYYPTLKTRIFKIELMDNGMILVDNMPYLYTVSDQISHQLMSLEVQKSKELFERPLGKACFYCIYKQECFNYDACGGSTLNDYKEVNNV